MNNRISNDERRVTNQGILSVLFFKEQSEASPPACKPMKPTGWKRARRDCSAYASESDIHNSSIVNRYSSFDMLSFAVRLSGISYEALLA